MLAHLAHPTCYSKLHFEFELVSRLARRYDVFTGPRIDGIFVPSHRLLRHSTIDGLGGDV